MGNERVRTAFEIAVSACEIEKEYDTKIAPLEAGIIEANVAPEIQPLLDGFYSSLQGSDNVKKEVVFVWKGNESIEIPTFHQIPHEPLSIRAHTQMKNVLELYSEGKLAEEFTKFFIVYKTTTIEANEVIFGLAHIPGKELEFFLASNKINTITVSASTDSIKEAFEIFKRQSKESAKSEGQRHTVVEKADFTPLIINMIGQGSQLGPPTWPSFGYLHSGHKMVPGDFP